MVKVNDKVLLRLRRLVSDEFRPATEDEVAALENRVGPLPPDYRDFLLSYGSAIPDEELFVTDATGRSIDVLGFYGLSDEAELRIDEESPVLTDGLVPLAENGMGDMFYVDVHDGRCYRDDDDGDRMLSSGTTVVRSAGSVADFLDRLVDVDESVE